MLLKLGKVELESSIMFIGIISLVHSARSMKPDVSKIHKYLMWLWTTLPSEQ